VALRTSPLWWIIYFVIAVLGIAVQYQTTRRWEIASYNRWTEMAPAPQA
jgi:hypothetical protein